MLLNINAVNDCESVLGNNENLVILGEVMLRDGRFSGEVELTGTPSFLVNAGYSRTYLFRDGIVEQLNVGEVGLDSSLAFTEITDRLQDGDIILICSDSLADVVNDDYLEYFLINSVSPAEDLAEWARENGVTDNISVIAALVGGGEFGHSDDFPDDDGRFDAWV